MDKVHIVVQARVGSSRLPGKTLLPLAGYPVGVLAAARLGNKGRPVTVAIPDEPSDDVLAKTLQEHGQRVVRGSLNDVLQRFLDAIREVPDETLIVRCTADNVFPDGELIEELIASVIAEEVRYLCIASPESGVPYGVSAETFYAGDLRASAAVAKGPDREHVTPALRRLHGVRAYQPEERMDMSHLRCTIDLLEDYQRCLKVFANVSDPVGVSWKVLCSRLDRLEVVQSRPPQGSRSNRSLSALTFGTAQLGLPNYGRMNATGRPAAEAAANLIQRALAAGVRQFDCARAYGEAEERVGASLPTPLDEEAQVVTKLSPLDELSPDSTDKEITCAIEASVFRSCRALGVHQLPVLLLHRWAHYSAFRGEIWKTLLSLKREGVIARLGASVYSPKEATEALGEKEVEVIQLPCNILDWRWRDSAFQAVSASRDDVEIYVRSAFLQGVLLADSENWPTLPELDSTAWTTQLARWTEEFQRESIADLCIAFLRGLPWVDSIVVGMETEKQLDTNLDLFQRSPLSSAAVTKIENHPHKVTERLLNPQLW